MGFQQTSCSHAVPITPVRNETCKNIFDAATSRRMECMDYRSVPNNYSDIAQESPVLQRNTVVGINDALRTCVSRWSPGVFNNTHVSSFQSDVDASSDSWESLPKSRAIPVSKAVVSVENFRSYHICNGVLVDNDVALTAAHCVNGVKDNLHVRTNSKVVGFGGALTKVRKICPITGYDFVTRNNDIAVLRLNSPVTGVTPAKLPTEGELPQAVTLAHGWGFSAKGDLRAVRVVTANDALCREHYGSAAITESMQCLVYAGGAESCLDAAQGTPVLRGDTVVAINAAVGTCLPQGPHGIFSTIPVSSIRKEIEECN